MPGEGTRHFDALMEQNGTLMGAGRFRILPGWLLVLAFFALFCGRDLGAGF